MHGQGFAVHDYAEAKCHETELQKRQVEADQDWRKTLQGFGDVHAGVRATAYCAGAVQDVRYVRTVRKAVQHSTVCSVRAVRKAAQHATVYERVVHRVATASFAERNSKAVTSLRA